MNERDYQRSRKAFWRHKANQEAEAACDQIADEIDDLANGAKVSLVELGIVMKGIGID